MKANSLTLRLFVRFQVLLTRRLQDSRGQDLLEYSLMAGFVATAAGALMPGVATKISTIFSKVASVASLASAEPVTGS